MEKKYIELVEQTWGEDEDFAYSLYHMLGGNLTVLEKVLLEDLSFNRYTCDVSSWPDLLEAIIQDECFANDEDYKDYIDSLIAYRDKSEEEIKEYLISQNWAIDTVNDIAIGFDEEIKVIKHELSNDI